MKKYFKNIRIILYILIFASLLWLKFTDNTFGECYIFQTFGFHCPSCGITRATKELLNLNFLSAIMYNAYYVLILLPIFIIFLINDIICIIINKTSFVDIILRTR